MNKSNAAFLVLAVVVLATVGFYGSRWLMPAAETMQPTEQSGIAGDRPNPIADQNTQAQPELITTNAPDQVITAQSGTYLPFTPEVMSSAATGRRVLFFYANWCPTCASAQKDFEINRQQLPADLTLIRVNYNDTDTDDDEKALAKQYGITYQHTFVQIDANGKALLKWNGGELQELLDNLNT